MTPSDRVRLRKIAGDAVVGSLFGALLALPMPIAGRLIHDPGSPLQTAGLGVGHAVLIAIAPGLVIALGAWRVGVPLNALIWAGSWVVWRSRNPHGSAVAAKVITAACWLGWAGVALLVSVLPLPA